MSSRSLRESAGSRWEVCQLRFVRLLIGVSRESLCIIGDLTAGEGRGVKEESIHSSIKPGGSLLASQAIPGDISPSAKQQHPPYPAHRGGGGLKNMGIITGNCSR